MELGSNDDMDLAEDVPSSQGAASGIAHAAMILEGVQPQRDRLENTNPGSWKAGLLSLPRLCKE